MQSVSLKLNINGEDRSVPRKWGNETLLVVLREHFALTGTKYSCGTGLCGACTVHVNGEPVTSCVMPVSEAAGARVRTIEGLRSGDGGLHPLQQAWIDQRVPQCGYCQSGQLMRAAALLEQHPAPSDRDITAAMDGNLCRCGTYDRIKNAIRQVAQQANQERAETDGQP